jgi:hypothetical protein
MTESREDQCMVVTCWKKTFSVKFYRRRELDKLIAAVNEHSDQVLCLAIYEPNGDLLYYATKTGSPLDDTGMVQFTRDT